jgi:hypothetical protein
MNKSNLPKQEWLWVIKISNDITNPIKTESEGILRKFQKAT